MEKQKYSIYDDFDIEKHKRTYIDYLEIVIDKRGKVMYTIPSHQEKMIAIACENHKITRKELTETCPHQYMGIFLQWLSMTSGACTVRVDFVMGYTFTNKQIQKLVELKNARIYRGEIPINKNVDKNKRKGK